MGIIENVKASLGKKYEEHKEHSERERRLNSASKIAEESTYRQEYAKASLNQARETATKRAKEDAYNRTHRFESITKRLDSISSNLDRRGSNTNSGRRNKSNNRSSGNRLGASLSGAGDFGQSIGAGYSNMGLNDGHNFLYGKKKR